MHPHNFLHTYIHKYILFLSLCFSLSLTGCDVQSTHNSILDIPLSAQLVNDDQATLQNIASQLPAKQRTLLHRYLIRVQPSSTQAQSSVAITIGQAIAAQQQYEQPPSHDPIDTKTAKAATKPQLPYSIELIPIQIPPALNQNTDQINIRIKSPNFDVYLANHTDNPIHTFTGTLVFDAASFSQPQAISIPLTQFEPAIAHGSSGQLVINRSMKNADILEKITDVQTATAKIVSGEITLTNGQHITIKE
ncbi:hypothetical protein [Psychrobacter sp. I-STPA10]|uniref:hypothetical protein n=1 Tax=Psychrobacter sp. I-STPA10 TaxID=2585769 RepID=UPI001E315FBE|nr:hypothetical protein [Psychrobacter sp. I-STPA10]